VTVYLPTDIYTPLPVIDIKTDDAFLSVDGYCKKY